MSRNNVRTAKGSPPCGVVLRFGDSKLFFEHLLQFERAIVVFQRRKSEIALRLRFGGFVASVSADSIDQTGTAIDEDLLELHELLLSEAHRLRSTIQHRGLDALDVGSHEKGVIEELEGVGKALECCLFPRRLFAPRLIARARTRLDRHLRILSPTVTSLLVFRTGKRRLSGCLGLRVGIDAGSEKGSDCGAEAESEWSSLFLHSYEHSTKPAQQHQRLCER